MAVLDPPDGRPIDPAALGQLVAGQTPVLSPLAQIARIEDSESVIGHESIGASKIAGVQQ